MAPPKGHPRWGGRKKGTLNKATAEAKALVMIFLGKRSPEEIEQLWTRAKSESATKALAMWWTAQEFVIPKLGRTEHTGPDGGPLEFVIRDLGKGAP